MMTNGDPGGQLFHHTLTQIMDTFPCSPLFFLFKNKLPEVTEFANIQFHMMASFNITMTSLDDHVREFQYN